VISVLWAVWLLCSPVAAETVRIGLFVGNNIGFGEDAALNYAEQEARDMARLFQSMGDLSRERTVLVTGRRASEVRDAMFQVEAMIRESSARGDDVVLIFFYSGHASGDGLHLSGSLLPMTALRRWLEVSAAQVRIAFVDACESGSLAMARGGTPVEAVEIVVDDKLTVAGLAVITSTGPVSVARESESFGGGVFTQALLGGLRGNADADSNGEITLDEAYSYAFAETVIGSVSMDDAVQRPQRRFEISGVGSLVLTRLPSRAAGLILGEELEGVYKVVSVGNGQVVARIDKSPGVERRLSLPTGRYVVRKVRQQDVLLAEVDLVWGGDRWLEESQMNAVPLGDPLARGGWNLRPLRLSARAAANSAILQGTPTTRGGSLELRYLIKPTLGVVGFADHAWGEDETFSAVLVTTTSRAGVGVSLEQHLPRLDLSVSGGPQLALVTQRLDYVDFEDGEVDGLDVVQGEDLMPGVWLAGGVHLPIGPIFGLDVSVRGSAYQGLVDEQDQVLIDGQLLAGLSASFGGRQIARARRGGGAAP